MVRINYCDNWFEIFIDGELVKWGMRNPNVTDEQLRQLFSAYGEAIVKEISNEEMENYGE